MPDIEQLSAKHDKLIISIIVALAFAIRLFTSDATSLWGDEAFSWFQASQPTLLGVLLETARDNYPPLHNLILHFTIELFGTSEPALRLPSVVAGTATVYVTYLIGKDVRGPLAGQLAALFLCISLFHVWYSIEARMYALLALTSALYVLTSMRVLAGRTTGTVIAYVLSASALLLTQAYGLFVFVA